MMQEDDDPLAEVADDDELERQFRYPAGYLLDPGIPSTPASTIFARTLGRLLSRTHSFLNTHQEDDVAMLHRTVRHLPNMDHGCGHRGAPRIRSSACFKAVQAGYLSLQDRRTAQATTPVRCSSSVPTRTRCSASSTTHPSAGRVSSTRDSCSISPSHAHRPTRMSDASHKELKTRL